MVTTVRKWKNSRELHVCVLPLQHDGALISFHSTCCCSAFFWKCGLNFLLALKLKVQEEISQRFENTPTMSGAMRKAQRVMPQWLTHVIYTTPG